MYEVYQHTRHGSELVATRTHIAEAIAVADAYQQAHGVPFGPYERTGDASGRSYEVYDGTTLIYRADGQMAGVQWRREVALAAGWITAEGKG